MYSSWLHGSLNGFQAIAIHGDKVASVDFFFLTYIVFHSIPYGTARIIIMYEKKLKVENNLGLSVNLL